MQSSIFLKRALAIANTYKTSILQENIMLMKKEVSKTQEN
jgi:hypothetical protein